MDAANDVANEIYERWVWCNIYRLHCLTILKKLQSLEAALSKLDWWPKNNVASLFWKKKQDSYQLLMSCLMFFVTTLNSKDIWREYKLQVTDEDYNFCDDQKGPSVARCLDVPLPLTSSDKQFIRRLKMKSNFSSSSACHSEIKTESAPDYASECESTYTHCTDFLRLSTAAEFVVESSNILVSSQNRRKWLNVARMCEWYQLSDRAAAAVASSVLVDVGITDDDKTCVIDHSKLQRKRERC